jgi:hypothetical protein
MYRTMRQALLTLAVVICVPVWVLPALPISAAPPDRTWTPGAVYLQIGRSCVGYALAAWLDAAPNPVAAHASGWQIYQAAQEQDGIAGPHEGTTVEAGLAVLARLGYVHDWERTSDPVRALAFLRTDGPLVLETNFPSDRPGFDRARNLVLTGGLIRHAWLCYSVDAGDRLGCQNSEGRSWNAPEAGRFHITRQTLVTVLQQGQAWLIHKSAARPAA